MKYSRIALTALIVMFVSSLVPELFYPEQVPIYVAAPLSILLLVSLLVTVVCLLLTLWKDFK